MPVVSPDRIRWRDYPRIIVAGTSGSGKTTTARRIAAQSNWAFVEIDSLHHGPGWVKRTTFESDVAAFVQQPRWVIEWQYDSVRAQLLQHADLVVWLDLPVALTMWQVISRTVTRRLRRVELWNGNFEPPLRSILTDPDHIIRWAWNTRHESAGRMRQIMQQRPELPILRLRSRRALDRWIGS